MGWSQRRPGEAGGRQEKEPGIRVGVGAKERVLSGSSSNVRISRCMKE